MVDGFARNIKHTSETVSYTHLDVNKRKGYSKNEFYQWAIELNDIEQPIGSISVVSLNEDVQSAELGYCIGKSWWHQGYTTEAVEAVIRFLMAEVGAGRVWSQHDVANPNSCEVMKKAGMDYEGTLRQSLKDNQGIVDLSLIHILNMEIIIQIQKHLMK